MTVGLFHAERFGDHRTGAAHPERPERLRAIEQVLRTDGLWDVVSHPPFDPAAMEVIATAHAPHHAERVRQAVAEGLPFLDSPDTPISGDSYDVALLATGAAFAAVDAVIAGRLRRAFCLTRPPGHHAEFDRCMGFCLFNHIALAAEHLRGTHGIERVAIVDFDVHHGNGTQHMFWPDADMFYGSTHQMPLFPGTGAWSEQGVAGNIVNAPLRSGDDTYHLQEAFESRILPALHDFSTDLLIISAGFDAHRDDPIGGLALREEDFAWVTRKLLDVANRHSGGRLVSVLEGGYDLGGLARSVEAHVRVLMEYAS